MARKKAEKFYAVARGRVPGIYPTWAACEANTKGWPQCLHKSFDSEAAARQWIQDNSSSSSARPLGSSTATASSSTSTSTSTFKSISQPGPSSSIIPTLAAPSASRSFNSPLLALSARRAGHATLGSTVIPVTSTSTRPDSYNRTRIVPDELAVSKARPKVNPLKVPLQTTRVDENGYHRTRSGRIVVWTDGSCPNNGKMVGAVAGAGVYWGKNHPKNIAVRVPGEVQTNNRGELLAILLALEHAPSNDIPLEIRSDSTYCIQIFTTWLASWRSKPTIERKNWDLVQHIAILIDRRRGARTSSIDPSQSPQHTYDADSSAEEHELDEGSTADVQHGGETGSREPWTWSGSERTRGSVRFRKVQAHVGIEGNEGADQLANQGALLDRVPDRVYMDLAHFKRMPNADAAPVVSPWFSPANTSINSSTDVTFSKRKRDSSYSEADDDDSIPPTRASSKSITSHVADPTSTDKGRSSKRKCDG